MGGEVRGELGRLDLNLLVVLRALLRERNVTRAARRVGVSQPAASAALGRLRRHFGDELLVRERGRYVLSPLAAQLVEQVESACVAVERIFSASARFDPKVSTREFTLILADYSIAIMAEPLSRLMDATATGIRLHVRQVKERQLSEVSETLRMVDGIVVPAAPQLDRPDIRSVELFQDRWVCVTSADNPLVPDGRLGLADLARLSWVLPYYDVSGYPPTAPITRQLALFGIRPHVAVRVESYSAIPYFVAGTDRIALMQHRLARRHAHGFGLRVLECPGDPDPVVERLWWHAQHDDDPAHAWLRATVTRAAADL